MFITRIKYKTHYKLKNNNTTVAYKIYAGFYVFFISPSLYEESLNEGLIEKQDPKYIEVRDWNNMTGVRGVITEYRIEKALSLSNLIYLKESLEITNKESGLYVISYFYNSELYWKTTIDTSSFSIESFEQTEFDKEFKWKNKSLTYIFMIDFLCGHLDRTYMNSRHIVDKLQEVNGFETTIGPYDSFYNVKIEHKIDIN